MFVDAIRRLYAYDAEATGRVLDTAAKLSPDQFVARVVEGQRSVRDTVHMIDTQVCHFSWINGSMSREESFARRFPPEDYPDIARVRWFGQPAAASTRDLLATLRNDADLAQSFSRTPKSGGPVARYL